MNSARTWIIWRTTIYGATYSLFSNSPKWTHFTYGSVSTRPSMIMHPGCPRFRDVNGVRFMAGLRIFHLLSLRLKWLILLRNPSKTGWKPIKNSFYINGPIRRSSSPSKGRLILLNLVWTVRLLPPYIHYTRYPPWLSLSYASSMPKTTVLFFRFYVVVTFMDYRRTWNVPI